MASDLPSLRTQHQRPALWVALGAVVVGTAAGLVLYSHSFVAPLVSPTPQSAAQQAGATTAPQKPSFDIVRVNPKGDAVMAGRATPGAKVIISDGSKEIGEAQADSSGDWIFIPPAPLTPGARTLTLTQRTPDGVEAKGDHSVVLVVPETATANSATRPPAMAVLTGPNVPPVVLTGPAAPEDANHATQLGLSAAEYGEHDHLRVAGTAAPGATVRVYLDDKPLGEAVAGPDGKWSLSGSEAVAQGEHHIRVDQVTANDAVASRIEQTFSRTQLELAAGRIIIAPGQNLWTIARHAYGHGTSYLLIFQANRQAIRNPSLIYPGQVFALPAAGTPATTPVSSSTSR